MAEWIEAATRQELPNGGRKQVSIANRAIVVFNIDGSYYAIDDVCTHDGGPVGDGELLGDQIMCPRHGARFDVRTGKALCMPAFEPIAVHSVELRGDSVVVSLGE